MTHKIEISYNPSRIILITGAAKLPFPGIMGSVLVIIFQFLNNSKRNARQPGQLSDSCPKGKGVT